MVGKTILACKDEVFGDDFLSYAMALTAAASDARMAGCTLPAMSNSGSGNQGITVSMPIIAYALKHNISDEKLARALILSNLIAIHIKGYLGRLSALCGCVVASTGSSCGLVWIKGGGYEEVCYAIKNMIGNITGMVCDGAKVGCAMKLLPVFPVRFSRLCWLSRESMLAKLTVSLTRILRNHCESRQHRFYRHGTRG